MVGYADEKDLPVSAKIIKHADFEDTCDDANHPIPSLNLLDINIVKKTGGSDLVIVVASPLMADKRSQQRLLTKIQNYLGFLRTPGFQSESGAPNSDITAIVVKLHPDSHPAIFELLEHGKEWVNQNGASLRIEALTPGELGEITH